MINKPTEEEEERIINFLNNGYFTIHEIRNNFILGVKKGYTKQLYNKGYNKKEIVSLLNRIENLINYGAICSNCLIFTKAEITEDNKLYFNCLKCGDIK